MLKTRAMAPSGAKRDIGANPNEAKSPRLPRTTHPIPNKIRRRKGKLHIKYPIIILPSIPAIHTGCLTNELPSRIDFECAYFCMLTPKLLTAAADTDKQTPIACIKL